MSRLADKSLGPLLFLLVWTGRESYERRATSVLKYIGTVFRKRNVVFIPFNLPAVFKMAKSSQVGSTSSTESEYSLASNEKLEDGHKPESPSLKEKSSIKNRNVPVIEQKVVPDDTQVCPLVVLYSVKVKNLIFFVSRCQNVKRKNTYGLGQPFFSSLLFSFAL